MKVDYISHMGGDLAVVNAARVSFSKQSSLEVVTGEYIDSDPYYGERVYPYEYAKLSEKDEKLIQYLARNNHWTPFAHTAITLRMQAPIPIRTQCFKHKVGFVENEESRRYIDTTPTMFHVESFRSAHENKKQGSGGEHPKSEYWKRRYTNLGRECIYIYENAIADGVCPEQARFLLPQGVEVQWIWTGSLTSFVRFYKQRTDPHAQKEVQHLANMVGNIIEPLFPISWGCLVNG